MKTDAQLKKDITDELDWEPSVNATHIGVSVGRGVVTLTGHSDTYAEKAAIERAVQRVQGVRALALELDVKLAPTHQRSDTELAQVLQSALQAQALVPASRVTMKVEHGWVTLSGELDWDYQRSQAEREARGIEVSIAGSTATLRGAVHSWAERNAARGAAWSAPGITLVVNELRVQP